MHLLRSLLAASALAITIPVALSSCVLPLQSADANCASYCALLQGCGIAGAPSGDCGAWCSAFATTLEHVGCKAQFDDAAACAVAEQTCQAASCTDITQSYVDCTTAFCSENPADEACPTL